MADSKTKFAEFLKQKKLDARRVLLASHKLETLHAEDRGIKLNKRRAKKAEGGDVKKEERKPRSGRRGDRPRPGGGPLRQGHQRPDQAAHPPRREPHSRAEKGREGGA